MKTNITVTITVEREGSPAETFTHTNAEKVIEHESCIFVECVPALEGAMSSLHRRFNPMPEDSEPKGFVN
jgi:hypothetical protein